MIIQLWKHLTKKRRIQFLFLLALMFLASITEVVSIGSLIPFLGALTAPEQIYQHNLTQPLIQFFSITEPAQLLLPLTIIFVTAILIAAIVRLVLLYVLIRLANAIACDLSIDIYRRTLYQDYSFHTSRNSSEIINLIINKTNTVASQVLLPLLNFISAIIFMIGIISIVVAISAKAALITFSILAFSYLIITSFTKKYLLKNGKIVATQSTQMIKSLQEGLGGIRDVLIDGTQEFYSKIYQYADQSMRKAAGQNNFIKTSPRYLMEAIGMTLIAVLAYYLSFQKGGVGGAIPILGGLAISAQRLLPSLQLAYSSYSSIKGAKASLNDVLNLLKQPLPKNINLNLINPIPFEHEIVFKDLSFRYSKDTPWILKNVNLKFKKGERIGFIGVTGSGKSTLLDILMGLLQPTKGELLIDDLAITQENRRAWQMHISHVPQSIYLADTSIKENIAFGIGLDQINEYQVVEASQHAQISNVIDSLKNKYEAFIGEQGVQLSGGQRQRIGIARALYKNSSTIILDEATSALDNQTEKKIMEQISQLKESQTIFIIAHRISTLKQCDSIFRLNPDFTIEKVNFDQIYK
jgi:ATP-binding cassette, subfamily B, bacterial PglK